MSVSKVKKLFNSNDFSISLIGAHASIDPWNQGRDKKGKCSTGVKFIIQLKKGHSILNFDFTYGSGNVKSLERAEVSKLANETEKHKGYSIIEDSIIREMNNNMYSNYWVTRPNDYKHRNFVILHDYAYILQCLIEDSHANDQSFSDWCRGFGYNDDSIAYKKTYDACCDIAKKLLTVFSRSELNDLYDGLRDLEDDSDLWND